MIIFILQNLCGKNSYGLCICVCVYEMDDTWNVMNIKIRGEFINIKISIEKENFEIWIFNCENFFFYINMLIIY